MLNVCFVSFPEQGNAYITCMPGPVRRWNHPVPLCIGGICLFFSFLALVCIFARTYWDCVSPDLRILFDVAKQQSPFCLCESLTHTFLLTFCGLSLLLHFWRVLFLPVRCIIMHSPTMYRRTTLVLLLHQEKQYFHCRSRAVLKGFRGSEGCKLYIFCSPSSEKSI